MPDEMMEAGVTQTEPVEETATPAETTEGGQPTVEELQQQLSVIKQERDNLDKLRGKQGAELGALRKAQQDAAQKMAQLEQLIQNKANPPTDWDAQIAAIEESMDEGTILPSKGARMIAELASERSKAQALQEAQAMYQQQAQQQWTEQQNQRYIEKNPDFPEFHDRFLAGEFDDIRQEHPYYNDPVLLHKEVKSRQLQDEIRAAREAGKQSGIKEAKKLSSGTEVKSKVLDGSGSDSASKVKPPPKTHADMKAKFKALWEEKGGKF